MVTTWFAVLRCCDCNPSSGALQVDDLDPCLTVAFLCEDEAEFDDLCSQLSEIEDKLGALEMVMLLCSDSIRQGVMAGQSFQCKPLLPRMMRMLFYR